MVLAMSGGEWLIRQERPPNEYGGRLIERITVEGTASGRSEPSVDVGPTALIVEYADGRILIYPWANIVSAEYRPHPEP